MRYFGILFLFAIGGPGCIFAQETVADHWSPYNYPREIPAGVKYHIVVDGDTLWSITESYLGDPLLWPQVYAKNAYILDPDLIYPGDPIMLDIGVIVGDETLPQDIEGDPDATVADSGQFEEMTETGEGGDIEGADDLSSQEDISNVSEVTDFGADNAEFVILPAGDRFDMECSTFIYPLNSRKEVLPFDLKIAGGENNVRQNYSKDDVVYLNKGLNAGVSAGAIYSVRRPLKRVYNDGKLLGMAVDQVGRLQVVAVQDVSATAVILDGCYEVKDHDFLVPYEQEPIPLVTELPAIEPYKTFDTSVSGAIIWSEDRLASFGKGWLTNIDLGIEQNIGPGDILLIYRPNPNNRPKKGLLLPHIFLGHGVALKTGPGSTVMKVIASVTDMKVGDLVTPITPSSFN